MSDVMIDISKEYAAYPAGRDENDGPFNGQRFREEILLPRYNEAKEAGKRLIVSLAGVMSFGSSFLEEAFGGMVRVEGINKKDFLDRLEIRSDRASDKRYIAAIREYIKEAN
ncbi:hypothetical protein XMM379_000632 [Aliiroseovarius sp. xm-m-379]|uniref:STAS-like domain-containing protein n=1 Tax=unclassified Aliiroseovarius TaxID=2623558 RepID=UPI0019E6E9A8|nr:MULTISPECIES: STAS-like domain-containing protein [unclassified Aliiroseovarius]NRP11462.1 hypothetical protein [Aliiroseovarius sp. xm-d-517]NRP23955.1 hypothetical protein [Aliiroseovarius sp. xm-m-379]NRP28772.1 hypothetical protein [Aliiroseovarius sp. xm-m-314]NRP32754.1 hypothetical protein [Aliiroseovarius sp. xm-a-104]NRP42310.1 hypothetical protein [Aliiroseovarius sp. xm-m-339-2]